MLIFTYKRLRQRGSNRKGGTIAQSSVQTKNRLKSKPHPLRPPPQVDLGLDKGVVLLDIGFVDANHGFLLGALNRRCCFQVFLVRWLIISPGALL